MVRALPVLENKGQLYFVDERLKELRNVLAPWDRIPLKDYNLYWIRHKGKHEDD